MLIACSLRPFLEATLKCVVLRLRTCDNSRHRKNHQQDVVDVIFAGQVAILIFDVMFFLTSGSICFLKIHWNKSNKRLD